MRNKIEVGFAPQSGFSRWMGSVDRVVRLALELVGSPFKVLLFLGSYVRPVSWSRRIVRTVSSFFYTVGEIGEEIRADTTKVMTVPLAYLVGGLLLTARVLGRVRHFPLSRIAAQSLVVVRHPFILVVWIIAILALAGRSAWMTTSVPYGYLIRAKDAVMLQRSPLGSLSLAPLLGRLRLVGRKLFIFTVRSALILALGVRSIWMITSLPYGYLIRAKDAVMPQRSPLGSLSLAPLLGRLRLVGRKLFIFMVRSALIPALGVRSIWMIISLPYTYLLKLASLARRERGLDQAIPYASPVEEPILPASRVEEPVPLTSVAEEPISPAKPVEDPSPATSQSSVQTVDLARRSLFQVITKSVAYLGNGPILAGRALWLFASIVLIYILGRLSTIPYLLLRLLTAFIFLVKVPFLIGRGVGFAGIAPFFLLAFYSWLWLTTATVPMTQSVRSVGNKVFRVTAFPIVLLCVWLAMVVEYVWLRPTIAAVSLPSRLAFRGRCSRKL